jgi:hypothetical protein
VIGRKLEFHAKLKVADEEKVDEESSEASEEVGFDGMEAFFIGVDEAKNEDVMSNNNKNVREVIGLYLHVNNESKSVNKRFKK